MKADMTEEEVVKLNDLTKKIAESYTENDDQIQAANEDMLFCNVDGGMWLDYLPNLGVERTKLELDITSDYVNRYVGEWTMNPANVTFVADDEATTEDDSELLTGIYRADFNDNDGTIAEANAVAETAECGIGHFKLLTKFEDEEDPENERQNVHWEPIYSSYRHVVWDRQAKRVDKADAKWCTVLTPYTETSFRETFPDAAPYSAYTPYTNGSMWWIDRGEDTIYVAEHYEIKIENVTVHVYQNLELGEVKAYDKKEVKDIVDELAEQGWEFVRERKIKRQVCEKAIFTAVEYIEKPKRIPGKYIPVIPMYGFRKFVNNREFYRGLVRKLKDANRLYNTNVSRMADNSATSGDRVPIFTDKQVEGREDQLADQTLPFHVINPIEDAQGNEVAAGPVGFYEPNVLDQSTIASTQVVSDYVQRITGAAPQDQITSEASGVLIDKLRKRENMGTQVMTDNILTAKRHSGKVYLSIADEIYSDHRIKRVMSEDGSEKIVKLNGDIFDDEKGKIVKDMSIQDKRFKVNVEVGPQYESQREATVETLERLLEKMGELPALQKYADPMVAMLLKNISGTGIAKLKDVVRDEMLRMGLEDPETEEEMQMLEQMSQEQDPQEVLNQSIAAQQQAEAESLMASAEQKRADTMKKKAETVEILEGIGKDPDAITRLKYNPETGGLESADSRRAS